MAVLFGACATIGVTLLICQLLLTMIGVGGDDTDVATDVSGVQGADGHLGGDVHHSGHHGSNWFFGVVTLRTLTAAVAFFGLSGLALRASGFSDLATVGGALVAGIGAMYLVHWMMQSLSMLRADGTARLDRTVGLTGTVTVRIPAQQQGLGKIVLDLPTGTVELEARTPGPELIRGSEIVVSRVMSGDILEVRPAKFPLTGEGG